MEKHATIITYGTGKHPIIALIDVAAKWTHEQMAAEAKVTAQR